LTLSGWPYGPLFDASKYPRDPAELELAQQIFEQELALRQEEHALDQEDARVQRRGHARDVWICASIALLMLVTAVVVSCLGFDATGLVIAYGPIAVICVAILRSQKRPDEGRSLDPRSRAPTKSSE
jgi:hypothetical protein